MHNPSAILLLPNVFLHNALLPIAILLQPAESTSVRHPIAVLSLPDVPANAHLPTAKFPKLDVLFPIARNPAAKLLHPVCIIGNAPEPIAILLLPVVTVRRVLNPIAIFPLPVTVGVPEL